MPPQTCEAAFARLDHAVMEFKQVRAESGLTGVSWIMADWQLGSLIPRFPERARQILDALDRASNATEGGDTSNQQSRRVAQ